MSGRRAAGGAGVDPELELLLDVELPDVVRRMPAGSRERYREEWSADILGAIELGLDPADVLDGARTTARRYRLRRAGDIVTGREGWWAWLVAAPALLSHVFWNLAVPMVAWWWPAAAARLVPLVQPLLPVTTLALLLLLVAPWHVHPARARVVALVGLAAPWVERAFATLHPGRVATGGPTLDTVVLAVLFLVEVGAPFVVARQLVLERRAAARCRHRHESSWPGAFAVPRGAGLATPHAPRPGRTRLLALDLPECQPGS